MASSYCKMSVIILLILNQTKAATLFNWFWSTPTDDTTVVVTDGVPLISIPYETMTDDEKFLREAAKFTNIQISSPLETCQHKIIMKIRTSCSDITEEQLAKLSVNLLNCQSAVEGRKMFPCTEEMSLKQCTTDMDADMWNAYHLMSNRARAICYAARSVQFRALTELTVNKLMQTSHSQIKTLISLKENQDRLMDQTTEVLSSLSEGNKVLLEQQQYLQDAQTIAHKLVITNLRDLSSEKAMIRLGHTQITSMIEDLKKSLETATQELVKHSASHSESHKELLNDLMNIRNQVQFVWDKIETSTNLILDQHQEAAHQHEHIMKNLAHVNNTIQYITTVTNKIRSEIERTINQLDWIKNYIGDTEEQLHKLYRITLHIIYLLIAMITAAFLNAPFWTRAAIMGIVPFNLISYLKHGLESSLDFISITTLIFLITGMHFLMSGIQYICMSRLQISKPIQSLPENRLPDANTHLYTSSPHSNFVKAPAIHSTIIKKLRQFYVLILHKIINFTGKTFDLIRLKILGNLPSLSLREQLSCSYVAQKKSHEDIYNYGSPEISDDILLQSTPDQYDDKYIFIDNSPHLIDANDLRYRLGKLKDSATTYLNQSNTSKNSSRSTTPLNTVPRMLCMGITRTGKRCRSHVTGGREFCGRHRTGESVIND